MCEYNFTTLMYVRGSPDDQEATRGLLPEHIQLRKQMAKRSAIVSGWFSRCLGIPLGWAEHVNHPDIEGKAMLSYTAYHNTNSITQKFYISAM